MKTAIIILAILWGVGFLWHCLMFRGVAEWTELIEDRLEAYEHVVAILNEKIDSYADDFETLNKRISELEKGKQ